MAPPEQAESLVQSNEATREGGITGNGFRKGQSGNPGGRPKGIARRCREAIGEDGDAVINFWAGVLTGEILTATSTVNEKGAITETKYAMEKVTTADRIAVSKLLAERGFGRPAEFVPIEDSDPLGLGDSEDASIADRLQATVIQLAERRRARETPTEEATDGS